MIQCAQCGQGNAGQAQFCRFCGQRLTVQPYTPQMQSPDYQNDPPRPYAWKTDEYQTQSEPRPTAPINPAHPPIDRLDANAQNYPPGPMAYHHRPVMINRSLVAGADKSRVAYILLGLFLGGLGIHNFYAGYTGKGIAQLLLNLFLFWTIVVPIAITIWVLVEVITIDQDAQGNRMI